MRDPVFEFGVLSFAGCWRLEFGALVRVVEHQGTTASQPSALNVTAGKPSLLDLCTYTGGEMPALRRLLRLMP